MQIIDLIQKRCSVRSYSSRPVEKEKLDYILEAARLAPSACNLQPWRFVVIRSPEGKTKIQACYERDWFKTAPLFILVCSDHTHSWKRPFDGKDHADIDAAIATEHLCLAATEQGLGTCWVCHFDTEQCVRSFHLPEGIEPVAIIPVGYPAEPDLFERTPKKRKPAEDVIVTESF
ncbi:MAG: nitroreductase family protein [Tannerella sp.]|jgi:nitroreductase|nr:nitroreductase family protein [Tannerella sp.]